MSYIQTVSGALPPEHLLFCHCHEHLMISKGVSWTINPVLWIDDFEKTLDELKSFSQNPGTFLVDAQPIGCNRMGEQLPLLAEQSGTEIIASTGFHKMIFYPNNHWIFQYDSSRLSDIFLHEIYQGMYIDCDNAAPSSYISAKAGMIKCALDTCGLNEQYKKLFDAAIIAANTSGVPLMVHIEKGSDPIMLADYLEAQKMDLHRVIFCHLDRACANLEVHKRLCERGIYLEYDTIGRPKYHDDLVEAGIFTTLINYGFEDLLLFSLDTTRARLKSYTPEGVGLNYIKDTFLPILRQKGVTTKQIQKISQKNCRQILSIQD